MPPHSRPHALAATLFGALVLACAWLGPLPSWADHSFAAHMTMHMGVVAVACPLLALGIASSRFDLVGRAPRLFSALVASFAELVVVWSFHAPALHHAARHLPHVRAIEQALFLLTGMWLWLSVFGGRAEQRSERRGPAVLALLLTSMHMTLLGALLALPQRLLYGVHGTGDGAVEPLGVSALLDQQLGGAIMLCVGGISYLAGGLALAFRILSSRGHPSGAQVSLDDRGRAAGGVGP